MTPKRIQRKRTKGWKMPKNTVSVTRPGIFGNPYWNVKKYGIRLCLLMFENTAKRIWDESLLVELTNQDVHWFYSQHLKWTARIGEHPLEAIRRELRGKDLACWCKEGEPCHADVLLELANEEKK